MQTTAPARLEEEYAPSALEAHWQAVWQARGTFEVPALPPAGQRKFYCLEMFPYPSGDMHMGHVRNYTIGDVLARYQRLQGACVLHPMGWDALGLPAENQAIREQVAPQQRTPQNIARMKQQAMALGLAYAWSREIATYLPAYYRWNQWFFLQLYAKDLVYRRQALVNFCPGCNTVLANEQVSEDKVCWRGHAGVQQRSIAEWAFRITRYAEPLLQGLDSLVDWPERIVAQQRHWLGKSSGATVRFVLPDGGDELQVFTTRLDTLYGCTYLVLAPEHPRVAQLTTAAQSQAVEAFVQRQASQERHSRSAAQTPKEGVFTGAWALHPLTQAPLPIWLANFVVGDYGSGAVMSVPAHDARDHAFALQYQLPIRSVLGATDAAAPATALPYTAEGLLYDSGSFSGLHSQVARQRMAAHLETLGRGSATTSWHLRDWGFSRQRYWGTPIPIVYCPQCGTVALPESQLPLLLPDFHDVALTGEGGAPLGKLPSFYEVACPRCGDATAHREVDTMDTFVDSAWYFARYLAPQLHTAPFTKAAADAWLPVDVYVGGPEHAVMHLLYFRFFTQVMRDLGLLSIDEPVQRLITQGMVQARAWRCPTHGYIKLPPSTPSEPPQLCAQCGQTLLCGIEKMSKSKYNGVDPLLLIGRYGADTARLYTLFAAPPDKDLEWNNDGVEGIHRFLSRLWRLLVVQQARWLAATAAMPASGPDDHAVRRVLHQTLQRVGDELTRRYHFNTAIAALMELCNSLYALQLHTPNGQVSLAVSQEIFQITAQMLAPLAPHLAESMWAAAGGDDLVVNSRWPAVDASALQSTTYQLAIQVNGKLRSSMTVDLQASEAEVAALARQDAKVARHLADKQVVKQIFVAQRLLNFVVRDAS